MKVLGRIILSAILSASSSGMAASSLPPSLVCECSGFACEKLEVYIQPINSAEGLTRIVRTLSSGHIELATPVFKVSLADGALLHRTGRVRLLAQTKADQRIGGVARNLKAVLEVTGKSGLLVEAKFPQEGGMQATFLNNCRIF